MPRLQATLIVSPYLTRLSKRPTSLGFIWQADELLPKARVKCTREGSDADFAVYL
jgi:hypothetical protein